MATLDELQARRALYIAAEAKILESQEYQIGNGGDSRRNRRAELEQVRKAITDLDGQISTLQLVVTRRVYRIVPGC